LQTSSLFQVGLSRCVCSRPDLAHMTH
jgi:hypothetical protein